MLVYSRWYSVDNAMQISVRFILLLCFVKGIYVLMYLYIPPQLEVNKSIKQYSLPIKAPKAHLWAMASDWYYNFQRRPLDILPYFTIPYHSLTYIDHACMLAQSLVTPRVNSWFHDHLHLSIIAVLFYRIIPFGLMPEKTTPKYFKYMKGKLFGIYIRKGVIMQESVSSIIIIICNHIKCCPSPNTLHVDE